MWHGYIYTHTHTHTHAYHVGLAIMQELSHLGNTTIVSIWFRMDLTQILTWVYIDSLTFTYPAKYHHFTSITILIPLGRCVDTIY